MFMSHHLAARRAIGARDKCACGSRLQGYLAHLAIAHLSMDFLTTALQVILLILVVLTLFNIIIFVHELGHFWAAKWRGLQVDRFQIWFGKPIWKKTVGGVQYGLGWIPAGGFVALPQMAPMESIEGSNKESKALPPIKPLDKIIVAFAGPLFSMLLALASAFVIWGVGKPKDLITTQTIGYVAADSPAAKAGLLPGDVVIAINGQKVNGFRGSLDSITEKIILSSSDELVFTVQREGHDQPIEIRSGFEVEDTHWYQRGGLRKVGISYNSPLLVAGVAPNSPAADAGLKAGDHITHVDGQALFSRAAFSVYLEEQQYKKVTITVVSPDGSSRHVELLPEAPLQPEGMKPMIGVTWDFESEVDTRIVRPGPFQQVADSLEMMWVTITKLFDRKSEVGVDHLSGPVGIGNLMFEFLKMDDGWRRILAFMVLFNVNLAVLNMLPFPVLDGGHITLAILEKLAGKPVQAKPLEILQTACALALISLMVYVTSKDAADIAGRGGDDVEIVFPE